MKLWSVYKFCYLDVFAALVMFGALGGAEAYGQEHMQEEIK